MKINMQQIVIASISIYLIFQMNKLTFMNRMIVGELARMKFHKYRYIRQIRGINKMIKIII